MDAVFIANLLTAIAVVVPLLVSLIEENLR